MSNFQYLMHLNSLAGRSYNDLMQYPVFPWVLRDYGADKLDLADPATFRDLARPMGAQTSKRLHQFEKRWVSGWRSSYWFEKRWVSGWRSSCWVKKRWVV